MTPPTQAEIDAALIEAQALTRGYHGPSITNLARVFLALAAERRKPGTIEVCERCRNQNFEVIRPTDEPIEYWCWTKCKQTNCPIRKPPTAVVETGE